MASGHRRRIGRGASVIRLLAIDLDGTLIGEDLVISPANRAAIAAAQAQGVRATLATGRMFRSTLTFARELKITTPLICYQGSLIRDRVSAEIIFHQALPLAASLEVIGLLRREGY